MDFDDGLPKGLAITLRGDRLDSTQADGSVDLVDPRTLAVRSSAKVTAGTGLAAGFSPGGSRVLAVPHIGRAVSFDLRPQAWARHACRVAGRAITRRAWRDALPERSFQRFC